MSDWDTWRDEFETLLWLSYGISGDDFSYTDIEDLYDAGYNPAEAVDILMAGD